jgi:hypothetical protein
LTSRPQVVLPSQDVLREVIHQELREAILSGVVDLGILGLWRTTRAPELSHGSSR